MASVELHFQEGFAGQVVDVTLDGAPAAQFTARTRLQTGLAQIETVTGEADAVVEVSVKALKTRHRCKIGAGGYLLVNLRDKKLEVQSSAESPGYM